MPFDPYINVKNHCGFNFDTRYTELAKDFFTRVNPTPVAAPKCVVINNPLAAALGLDFSALSEEELAALFSGNQLAPGAEMFAQAYAGHQFGHFTLLGDGRALVWGEHVTPKGARFDIQFKGSGPTPYSRRGDGRAVLGPMLREYLISEAMHHLGIATTRSLAVVTTGETVIRASRLPGAILTRVARSHIRVGTFEFAAHQHNRAALAALLDYTLKRHYPDLNEADNKALAFIEMVMERQIDLVVEWMRVGFIHGVMNTDNMTLTGETIDYGPCAFMDAYDPNTVFSAIDQTGRYAFANQAKVVQWNLAILAETLLPLIHHDMPTAIRLAEKVINRFPTIYQQKWLAMMCAKCGLVETNDGDYRLITDLLTWMQSNDADYTNTFRDLSQTQKPSHPRYDDPVFNAWYARWQHRRQQNPASLESSIQRMNRYNPVIIPRNHHVEQALTAAHQGDAQPFYALLEAITTPYQINHQTTRYQQAPTPSERVYQTFCGT